MGATVGCERQVGVVLDEKGKPRRTCGSLVDIDELMTAVNEKKALIK